MRTEVICTTTSGDEPIEIQWLKNNETIIVSQDAHLTGVFVRVFPPFSTLLTIPNITALNSGNYTCQVTNPAGRVHHTAQLIVSGKETGTDKSF